MSAETADREAELEKVCERLEAHMGQANMQEVLRDANEAARLLREMAAALNDLIVEASSMVVKIDGEFGRCRDTADQILSDPDGAETYPALTAAIALMKGKPHG